MASDILPFPVTFVWARSKFPVFTHTVVFFIYAALILFFGFALIPNFLPIPDWTFNVGGIALIFLLDWQLHHLISGYTKQGKMEVGEQDICFYSVSGRLEHRLRYAEIHTIQVMEGVPLSLFHFMSASRTVVIDVVFKDKRNLKFECVKWTTVAGKRIDVESCIGAVENRFGI